MLIAIAGRAGSGKTMLAELLCRESGYQVESFAQPIKQMAELLLKNAGYSQDVIDFHMAHKDKIIPILGVQMRWVLQSLGTEWGRNLINDDVWGEVMAHRLDHCLPNTASVVIDDLRFENEAAMVRARGGIVVHVEREAAPLERWHESEQGVTFEDGDIFLHNQGSPEDLLSELNTALQANEAMETNDELDWSRLLMLCNTPRFWYWT